ncbi:MAG: DNA translocase FtsK, partial [Bacteroidales bacterium]|nr:DNA translocase FtsK [Bacteroidales bacterium]
LLSLFVIILYSFKNSLFWIKSKLYSLRNVKKESLEEVSNDGFDKLVASEKEEEMQIQGDETQKEESELIVFNESEEHEPSGDDTDQPIKLDTEVNNKEDSIKQDDDLALDVNDTLAEEELSEEEIDSDMMQEFDPTKDLEFYKFPSIEILKDYPSRRGDVTRDELNSNKDKIVRTLRDYKIDIARITATIGPTVTLYEIVPAPGVRISKIRNLEDDIALSLSALGIRIIAPIPGKGTIGIEVPNSKPETVSMRSVLKSAKFQESPYELPVAMGKTISNETYVFNLAKTPHLLVAGATGQGKSVGINAIIASLIYKKHPAHLKFVLVDPKMVELSIYNQIDKHYLAKLPDEESCIVTDVSKVVPIMNSLCVEMDERYTLLTKARVRNIVEYNKKFVSRKLNPLKGHKYMPYIVVVIDEFADIIVQEGKQVEVPISRLAAKARAIGIHLIVATQRPSTDVITGVIKANFPTRIAFKVTNGHDSKTILDTGGANQLIGRGDMLISEVGKISRVQCAFIDTPEIELLVDHIAAQQGYPQAYILPEPEVAETGGGGGLLNPNEKDELFEEAARLIVRHQQGSTSLVQRKMSIGYNRAGRIIDQLEASGIVGPYEGSKARQVLYPDEYSLEQYLNSLNENK